MANLYEVEMVDRVVYLKMWEIVAIGGAVIIGYLLLKQISQQIYRPPSTNHWADPHGPPDMKPFEVNPNPPPPPPDIAEWGLGGAP